MVRQSRKEADNLAIRNRRFSTATATVSSPSPRLTAPCNDLYLTPIQPENAVCVMENMWIHYVSARPEFSEIDMSISEAEFEVSVGYIILLEVEQLHNPRKGLQVEMGYTLLNNGYEMRTIYCSIWRELY
jgi:hypothetical protein